MSSQFSALSTLKQQDAGLLMNAWEQLWPPGSDFQSRLAKVLLRLTNADLATVTTFDLFTGSLDVHVEPESWAPAVAEQRSKARYQLAQHPIATLLLEGNTNVMRLSDHVSLTDWAQSELYLQYYKPLDLAWEIVVPIPARGSKIRTVSLKSIGEYSNAQHDFTDRDMAMCAAVVPIASLGFGGLDEGTDDTYLTMASGWSLVRCDYARRVTHISLEDPEGVLRVGLQLPHFGTHPNGLVTDGHERVELADGKWLLQYVGGSATEHVIALKRDRDAPPDLSVLRARQRQVLELVAQGLTNDQIAYKLQISSGTVRKHIEAIFTQLRVNNRVEATAMWYANRARIPVQRDA